MLILFQISYLLLKLFNLGLLVRNYFVLFFIFLSENVDARVRLHVSLFDEQFTVTLAFEFDQGTVLLQVLFQ